MYVFKIMAMNKCVATFFCAQDVMLCRKSNRTSKTIIIDLIRNLNGPNLSTHCGSFVVS